MKELFITWILATMMSMAPYREGYRTPDAAESREEATERYQEIADAIVTSSFREDVKPLFGGPHGRAKTAMLVTAVFFTESGFRRDVDLGIGREVSMKKGLNDFGRSWCMGQVHLGYKKERNPYDDTQWVSDSVRTTREGWTGRELLEDREKCAIATINILRSSLSMCRNLPLQERLAQYAAGRCESSRGKYASLQKMRVFQTWVNRNRPAIADADAIIGAPEEDEVEHQCLFDCDKHPRWLTFRH